MKVKYQKSEERHPPLPLGKAGDQRRDQDCAENPMQEVMMVMLVKEGSSAESLIDPVENQTQTISIG